MMRIWILPLLCAVLAGCQSTGSDNRKSPSPEDRAKLADINTQLAIQYIRDGDNALALQKLEKAVEANPKSVSAHTTLGLLHARLGQNEQAEEHYRTALAIDPTDPPTLNNYGQFLCQQKRYADGQAKFADALKNPLNRAPETAHTNAGTCAMQAQDPAAAEQHFRAALQIAPQFAPALLPMAQLSFDQANYLSARGYFQRFLAVAPQTARTLWLGIRIERALDDQDTVASYAIQLKNKYPDSEEYAMYQQGKFD